MQASESLTELAKALNKAQAQMSGAKKTAKNPFFKSNYANLEEVINCVKEPFADNGLSFMQFPVSSDGFAGVETIILHESGEWISNEFTLKVSKNDPQGMGSAITYARRYGLQSAVGVPSEDDDGNAASTPSWVLEPPKPQAKEEVDKIRERAAKRAAKRVATPEVKMISAQQIANISTMRKTLGIDDAKFAEQVKHFGADVVDNLTQEGAGKLISAYTKKLQK